MVFEKSLRPEIGSVSAPSSKPEDIRVQIDLRLKKADGDIEVERFRHSGGDGAPTHSDLTALACRIYEARRDRDKVFDQKYFGEQGWDMLLALYCLPKRGERLDTAQLQTCVEHTIGKTARAE